MKELNIEQKRKKITNFMIWKDKKLTKIIGASKFPRQSYFNKIDKGNMMDFSDFEIEAIYAATGTQRFAGSIEDIEICPWCIIYFSNACPLCKYGKIHGICIKSVSTYQRIITLSPKNGGITITITGKIIRKYLKRNFK